MNDQNRLHVGDHVTDRDDPDATMLVVATPIERADEYVVDGDEDSGTAATVADYNDDYPADDRVVEVTFPARTDNELRCKRYAYPRSRLRRTAAIHDVGGDEGAESEGGAPLWRVEDALSAARKAAQKPETPTNRERVLTRIDEARALLTTTGLQDALGEEGDR